MQVTIRRCLRNTNACSNTTPAHRRIIANLNGQNQSQLDVGIGRLQSEDGVPIPFILQQVEVRPYFFCGQRIRGEHRMRRHSRESLHIAPLVHVRQEVVDEATEGSDVSRRANVCCEGIALVEDVRIHIMEMDGETAVRLDLEEDRHIVLEFADEPGINKVAVVPETQMVPRECCFRSHPLLFLFLVRSSSFARSVNLSTSRCLSSNAFITLSELYGFGGPYAG